MFLLTQVYLFLIMMYRYTKYLYYSFNKKLKLYSSDYTTKICANMFPYKYGKVAIANVAVLLQWGLFGPIALPFRVCVFVCVSPCVCLCACVCVCVYVCAYGFVHACAYKCVRKCVCLCLTCLPTTCPNCYISYQSSSCFELYGDFELLIFS